MSILCYVMGLSPDQVKALRATPDLATEIVMATVGEGDVSQLGPLQKPLDLHKSWHMLHYLFTGHVDASDAPGNALLTGAPLGEDVGYGPARIHDESRTQEFGQFLATVDLARLQASVNFQEMTRIRVYAMPMGPGSDAEYENELRAEVAQYFPLLRNYVGEMAAKKCGLLIWVS